MSATTFLSVQHVEKSFDNTPVLLDMNIDVEKGEFVVLLGPSGCGKTTLLRILAGLIEAEEGRIMLEGNDLSRTPTHNREIGFVFQRYALFPHMTVRENISYGLKIRKRDKQFIREKLATIVDLLELGGLEERKISEISGGQQQRVALARALVIEPKLLLLDEPLSNLDAKLRASVRVNIVEIQKKLGITTIMVTHDQIEAMTMGDRIILMNEGKIQQSGPPKELYANPKDRFVSEFIGSPKINTLPTTFDGTSFYLGNSENSITISLTDMCNWLMTTPPKNLPAGNYLLGIRPESMRIASDGMFLATIAFVEDCGADTHLHLKAYRSRIIMRINSCDCTQAVNDTVPFTFLDKSLYLFDLEGNRLA